MQSNVWRRWTDRQTMAMGRDKTKESRAARRRWGRRRRKQQQQKKRSYADKAFRGLTAKRWARPRSASHSITTLLFHSLAPEALRSSGDSSPTATQLPHHEINQRFMCRSDDFHNPFVFRRVAVKQQTLRQKPHLENRRPQISFHAASPVRDRW